MWIEWQVVPARRVDDSSGGYTGANGGEAKIFEEGF